MIRKSARRSSNAIGIFGQRQIAELKEAFEFVDQNRDGAVDRRDLAELLSSLGHRAADIPAEVDALMSAAADVGATSSLSFPQFVAMLGERVRAAEDADVLLGAFETLDRTRRGALPASELRALLPALGDAEFGALLRLCPPDAGGLVDYRRLSVLLASPLDSAEPL